MEESESTSSSPAEGVRSGDQRGRETNRHENEEAAAEMRALGREASLAPWGDWSPQRDLETNKQENARHRLDTREASLAPWNEWGRTLRPSAARSNIPPSVGEIAPLHSPEADHSPAPEREDVFCGVSARGRAAALQFVFELKLRAFGSRVVHQQVRQSVISLSCFPYVFFRSCASIRQSGCF
jgi:hypothetical protein